MTRCFLLGVVLLLLGGVVAIIAFRGSRTYEVSFELCVMQPSEMETHLIRDSLGDEVPLRVLKCFRELYPAYPLTERDVLSGVVGGRVKSKSGSVVKMSFSARSNSSESANAIACGYRKAIERLIEEKNDQLETRYLAQLQNRVRKLNRKFMQNGGDDHGMALTNALQSVDYAKQYVENLKIKIANVSFVCQ